jgi:hypothetical protein
MDLEFYFLRVAARPAIKLMNATVSGVIGTPVSCIPMVFVPLFVREFDGYIVTVEFSVCLSVEADRSIFPGSLEFSVAVAIPFSLYLIIDTRL